LDRFVLRGNRPPSPGTGEYQKKHFGTESVKREKEKKRKEKRKLICKNV
jgi:hypothetical protein